MKIQATKVTSLTIIFAALYAVAVIALAPISFNIFQVRVGDALLPLAIIFGWPAVIGIAIGTVVANLFGGLGIVDVIGGTAANFLATLLAWKIGNSSIKGSWIFAIGIEVLTVTLIVGSYLSYLFGMPLAIGLFGVLTGSLIAIGILGYLLLTAISRPFIVRALRSFGLELHMKDEI